MSIKISTGLVQYLADTGSLRAALAGESGKFLIFSTAQPGTANDVQSGLLASIGEVTFASPAVDGVISISGDWTANGTVAGLARSFRYCCDTADTGLLASTTAKRIDGTITEIGGGGDATIDNQNISIGQAATIISFDFGFNRG